MGFKEEYKKIENQSIKVIADYLLTRDDVNLDKPNKSLEEMWRYIVNEARNKATNNCICMTDDEVFGLAVHYYDEDDIKIEKPKVAVKTAVVKKEVKKEEVKQPEKPKKKSTSKNKVSDDQLSLEDLFSESF